MESSVSSLFGVMVSILRMSAAISSEIVVYVTPAGKVARADIEIAPAERVDDLVGQALRPEVGDVGGRHVDPLPPVVGVLHHQVPAVRVDLGGVEALGDGRVSAARRDPVEDPRLVDEVLPFERGGRRLRVGVGTRGVGGGVDGRVGQGPGTGRGDGRDGGHVHGGGLGDGVVPRAGARGDRKHEEAVGPRRRLHDARSTRPGARARKQLAPIGVERRRLEPASGAPLGVRPRQNRTQFLEEARGRLGYPRARVSNDRRSRPAPCPSLPTASTQAKCS